MKNPPHPGEVIREEVIRPLKLSVTAAAAALGVTRQALSAFLNERSDLSPEMALRIEVAFGPKADVMMGVQTDYPDGARAGAPAGDRGERAAGQRVEFVSGVSGKAGSSGQARGRHRAAAHGSSPSTTRAARG